MPVSDGVWAAVASGSLILVTGLFGIAFGQPWLFASLGSTAFEVTEYPEQRASLVFHVFAGHFLVLGMGFAAVALMGAWDAHAAVHAQSRDRPSLELRARN